MHAHGCRPAGMLYAGSRTRDNGHDAVQVGRRAERFDVLREPVCPIISPQRGDKEACHERMELQVALQGGRDGRCGKS